MFARRLGYYSMQILLIIPFVFLAIFLFLPLLHLIIKSISMGVLGIALPILQENTTWASFFTTFNLAIVVTLGSFFVATILAIVFVRFKFPLSSFYRLIFILPIVVPPFVSGIGIRKIFARFGPLNLVLTELGIINQPFDWLGNSGFIGVALSEMLHYYPIVLMSFLSTASALDYSLVEAARISGLGPRQLFTRILMPLFLPSTVASLAIIFAWSFTELGTPLIFNYKNVLSVKLYTALDSMHVNPRGYVYVFLVLIVSALAATTARFFLKKNRGISFAARGAFPIPLITLDKYQIYLVNFCLFLFATFCLLPQLSILFLSISGTWNMSIFPQDISIVNYIKMLTHPLVVKSIALSFILAILSCLVLLNLSFLIAFIGRRGSKLCQILCSLSNFSLVIPGIVLAYAYLEAFRDTLLDPRINPLPLLIMAYAIRRLPLMLNNLISAFSVSSHSLEEAARMSGSSSVAAFLKITIPLARPFIISAILLSFVFAMFEVSESLMLAQEEKFYPISKTMYALLSRPDGPGVACSLGVFSFLVTLFCILVAAKVSGRKFEELFRIS